MRIITDYHHPAPLERPIAAALGYFDGLHLGHRRILEGTARPGMLRGVVTFANQPAAFITGSHKPSRLLRLEDKIRLLEEMGVDVLFLYEFNEEMRQMSSEAFIRGLLAGFGVKYAVAGFNFNFGRNREGTSERFVSLCREMGIEPEVVSPVCVDGEVVSSTLIKNKLYAGDVSGAARLLGRPFSLNGSVSPGKKLGRLLGFPTANMAVDPDILVPKWGVYETRAITGGKCYRGVTNVGNNPTIEGDSLRVETHIIGFEREIYNEPIQVQFMRRIRDEKKFEDIMALKHQLEQDIAFVKNSR